MSEIICPITIAGQSISASMNSTARVLSMTVQPVENIVSAVISVGRKGDKGDPGGVNAISAGSLVTSGGTLVFGDSNGMSFGLSGNTLTASHNAITTGARVDHTHGDTPTLALTNLFGTASSGSAGLTLSLSAVPSAGTDTAGGVMDGYNIIGINGGTVHSAATINFQDGNNVSFGLAGSTVTAMATFPSQTEYSFANSNGVSFGISGSTVTAIHNGMASDAGSAFMDTGERGNYFYSSNNSFADSLHSHGNPSLNLTNISGSTASGSNGLTLSLSADHGIAFSAGTRSGETGTIVFSNSNGVSFGMDSNNRVTASHNGLTTAMATGERGNYFYTSDNTFAVSSHSHGAVAATGIGATSASNGLSLSVDAQSIQTQGSVAILGSSGAVSFANSNGISFGGNGSTITASHNALTTAAQSNHSHGNPTLNLNNISGTTASGSNGLTLSLSAAAPGMLTVERGNYFYTSNNTFANRTHTHGNPSLSLVNLSGATASGSNGLTLSLSANAAAGGAAISAGTQSGNTGTLVFSNSNGITFGMSGSSRITASHNGLTTAAQSGHSHGNPTLYLTNISGTTASASNGLSLSLSAPAGGGVVAYSASNGSAAFSTLTFANGYGVSFMTDGLGLRASVATDYILTASSSLLQATSATGFITSNAFPNTASSDLALVDHSHGNPTLNLTNINGTTASGSNGLTLNLSANAGGGGAAISAGTQSGNTGTIVFSNSNGISFGMSGNTRITASHNGLTTAAVSNHSHGNPTLNLTGINGTTASGSNGLTLSLSASGGGMAVSAGTQSGNTGTLVFANSNGVTFGMSGSSQITMSVVAGAAAGVAAMNNSNTTYTSGTIQLTEGGGAITIASGTGQRFAFSVPQTSSITGYNLTISTTGSTIAISAQSAPGLLGFESTENRVLADTTQSSLGQGSLWFAPFRVTGGTVNASTFRIAQSFTGTVTSAATQQWGQTIRWGLYSKVNSTQFSNMVSGSFTMQVWASGTSSNSWGYQGGTSSSGASNLLVTQFMGLRYHQETINQTLTQGDYMFGLCQSTSSAGYSALVRTAGILCCNPVGVAMGSIGQQTGASIGIGQAGRYSATTGAMPDTFGPSQVVVSVNVVPYVKMGAI